MFAAKDWAEDWLLEVVQIGAPVARCQMTQQQRPLPARSWTGSVFTVE